MSGSHAEVDPLLRPLLHSFDHARLDLAHWTEGMSAEEIWARPFGLGAVGFHIRHIAGSAERLFTYARGEMLTEQQFTYLKEEERVASGSREELLAQLTVTFDWIAAAVRALDPATLGEPRTLGRKRMPTTLAGLLVHIAEHTQRHVGEAIITAKVVRAGGFE